VANRCTRERESHMIYLRRVAVDDNGHVTTDIEALENDRRLEHFECKGYNVVTKAQWRAAWQANDERIPAIQEIERIVYNEQAVGDSPQPTPQSGGAKTPKGFTTYNGKKG
jgi:hypothetical protein